MEMMLHFGKALYKKCMPAMNFCNKISTIFNVGTIIRTEDQLINVLELLNDIELTMKEKLKMNFCNKISTQAMLNELTTQPEKNMVTSPMSINLILNMLTIGTVGRTKAQLMNALEMKDDDEINRVSASLMMLVSSSGKDGGPIISMANGMWSDLEFPFKASYRKLATELYKADIRSFDFKNKEKLEEVRQDVNAWAEKATNGLIKDLIGGISKDARIIKANALYFKGNWQHPFKKSKSRDEDFYLHGGKTIRVPFMIDTEDANQFYRSFDDFKLLKLPYQSGNDRTKKFSMYVFLPHEKKGLANLLEKFNSDPSLIHTKCDCLRMVKKTWIPKFQILFDFKPSDIMKEMGIKLPFKATGELTNMVDSVEADDLCVSTIYQKSYVEVNEEGTEAASVTYDGLICCCSGKSPPPPPPPVNFIADHPFVFTIKEDISGAVLFIGVVRNPLLPL